MEILITGGTGLIGRALCRQLQQAGHSLTVFSRRPRKVAQLCGDGVAAIGSWDEYTAERHFDAVINLAGEPIIDQRWSERRKQQLRASRIGLTEQLLARMRAASRPPAVLLSGSAIGVYGDCGERAVNEDSPAGSDFGAHLCADWEAAASAAQSFGTRVVLLRTGVVLAPDGGALAKMALSFRLGLGGQIGDGRQFMSWIHLDDYLALLIRALSEPGLRGPLNLVAPQPVSNAEFSQTLAATLKRPCLFRIPAALLHLAMGERALLLTGGQRVLPAVAQGLDFRFRFADLGSAMQNLLKPA